MGIFALRMYSIRRRMFVAVIGLMLAIVLIGAAGGFGMHRIQRIAEQSMNTTYSATESLARLRGEMTTSRRLERDMIIQYETPEAVKQGYAEWLRHLGAADQAAERLQQGATADEVRMLALAREALSAYRAKFSIVVRQLEDSGYESATVANKTGQVASVQYLAAEQQLEALERALKNDVANTLQLQRQLALRIQQAFAVAIGLLALLVVPATILNMRAISHPLEQTRRWSAAMAEGNLAQDISADGRDELTDLQLALARTQTGLSGMVGAVRGASESIARATAEIAEGNLDLSHRTENTAFSVEHTVSLVSDVVSRLDRTAESATTAHRLAEAASAGAVAGGEAVQQAVTSMQALSVASKRIVDITSLIDSIAFQTNILALNAAVEAARAGDQGRGFSVVAAEVRTLAQRSAGAAKDIKVLIGESVQAIDKGVGLVRSAGAAMGNIVNDTGSVGRLVGEITQAVQQQSEGITDISSSLAQIDRNTKQNAALVEESAAASESLRDEARRLAESVQQFHLPADAAAREPSFERAFAQPLKQLSSVRHLRRAA